MGRRCIRTVRCRRTGVRAKHLSAAKAVPDPGGGRTAARRSGPDVRAGDIAPEALTIPDFTLLWIIAADRYVEESGKSGLVGMLMPAIERALAWFDRHQGSNSLLEDLPHWHFIEWANLDRRGESCAVNALYSGALGAASRLAHRAERPQLAQLCERLNTSVCAALNERHWDETRGVYVDSVDPVTGARGQRVSQHANALMLLFDIAPEDRRAPVLAAITDRARLKLTAAPPIVPDGEAFDEDRDIVRANSFFAHFVYSGIAAAGGLAWVLADLDIQFGPMLATGTTTLWESFSPAASLCHGFSATPAFQLSRRCLGVSPTSAGYKTFALALDPAGLQWAKGVVPTPQGPITVDWTLSQTKLQVRVAHPLDCQMDPPAVDRAWSNGWRRTRRSSFSTIFQSITEC